MGLAIDVNQRADSIELTETQVLLDEVIALYKNLTSLVEMDRQVSSVQAIMTATDQQATKTLAARMGINTQAYYAISEYLNHATDKIQKRLNENLCY